MIYNCEFCVIDGSFREVLRKISRLRFRMTCFMEYKCCFDDFLVLAINLILIMLMLYKDSMFH